MCHHLEHPDLPQCDLFDDGIVLGLHKLLDGDDLPRVFVSALEDDAVRALSDLSNLFVLLHPQQGPALIRGLKNKTTTKRLFPRRLSEAAPSLQQGYRGERRHRRGHSRDTEMRERGGVWFDHLLLL